MVLSAVPGLTVAKFVPLVTSARPSTVLPEETSMVEAAVDRPVPPRATCAVSAEPAVSR